MIYLGPLIYYNIFKYSYLMYKLQSIFQYTTKIFIKMVFWCMQSLANYQQRFFQILLKCFFFLSFFFIDKNDTCEKWNAFFIKRIFVWRNPPFHENSCDMFVVCLQHYQLMQKFQKYITVNPINLQVLEPATLPGFTNFLSFSLYF